MNDRVRRVASEHFKNTSTPSVSGLIVAVNPDTESVTVDIGSGVVQITHPFVSGSSWIRALPGVGTQCTLSWNQASQCYDFVAYAPSQGYATTQLQAYQNRKSLYRSLGEGEMEFASSGGVTTYYSSRPVFNGRAGAVTWSYDSDKLETSATAPTHVTRGHNNTPDQIGNEIRFGVVKRPLSSTREMYALTAPLSNPVTGTYTYAYEHLISLSNDNSAPLIDHRQGEVYEDQLTPGVPFSLPALGSRTGLPLRSRQRFYSTIEPGGIPAPGKFTAIEISCLGDVDMLLSDLAIQGYNLIVPYGAVNVNAGTSASVIADLALLLKSTLDKITLNAAGGIVMTTDASVKSKATVSQKYSSGTTFELDAGTTMTINGVQVQVTATGQLQLHGKLGLSLAGALGATGRIVNTLSVDTLTGLPTFADPTITA